MSEISHAPPPQPESPPVLSSRKASGDNIGLRTWALAFVVIVILAALAAPFGQGLLTKARVLQTKASAKNLELSLKAYLTEYNRFPIVGGPDEQKTLEAQGEMLDVIMARHPGKNPRGIQFYDPPRPSPRGKGGLIINAAGQPELHDIFGNVYRMRFDWNRDGIIPDPEHPGTSIAAPVIIYSAGPDGDYNTWKDNVKSWAP